MDTLILKGRDMNLNDRFEVLEELLPGDEYDNTSPWYIYDNDTETVVSDKWFKTEKAAQAYLDFFIFKQKRIVGAPC